MDTTRTAQIIISENSLLEAMKNNSPALCRIGEVIATYQGVEDGG